MQPPIRIKVIKKTAPDLERFAAALLALAVARIEEAALKEAPKAEHETRGGRR